MANVSKYVKIHQNVLIQWNFDSNNYVSENYKVITNIQEQKKKSFLSTTLVNDKENNLFQIDPVLRKYTVVSSDYNYLQEQDFSSSPVVYDKVKVFLPTNYNFTKEGYIGFYVKVFAYGFDNVKIYDLSNIFYDNTNPEGKLLELAIPFIYDEVEWGKYFEFSIPSVNYVSNQRIVDSQGNRSQQNTINYNLTTDGEGLSQTAPIFVDFRFLTSKDNILDVDYFYATSQYRISIPKAPEYETLAVKIQESEEGDFFEIFGTYGEDNENLDNFIEDVETRGRKVRIEYDVSLYEENIQTNKQTFSVTENFSQKIYYRPIITFSNTTAAIKVTMKIIDLVDISQVERFTTIGIRDNIHKYGKKLLSIEASNINNMNIYNAQPEEVNLNQNYANYKITTEIRTVDYPLLVDVGKIIVNSPKSSKYYKGMGLLNIIITPFDNIIQFRIAEIGDSNNLQPYNLADILNNSELKLVFKSDTETIEKEIFKDSKNNYTLGVVNYKITENDIDVLQKIYDKGYTNFYLALDSRTNKSKETQTKNTSTTMKTLLYSGTFTFYKDIRFVDDGSLITDEGLLTDSEVVDKTESVEDTNWQPRAGKTLIIYTKSKYSSTNSDSQEIAATD